MGTPSRDEIQNLHTFACTIPPPHTDTHVSIGGWPLEVCREVIMNYKTLIGNH